MRTRSKQLACVALGLWLVPLSRKAMGQQFLPAGPAQDSTTSLGQFSIVVNPTLFPASDFVGNSYYDAATNILTSPLLYDPNTTINRSATTTVGSAGYNAGLPVFGGNVVTPGSLTYPAGYTPPANEDAVLTQINSFNLSGTPFGAPGWAATAGAATTVAGTPNSSGQVTSNATGANIGNPSNDFPATSFFDVFVNISALSLPGMLINTTPLIVENTAITSFPPVVIYTHDNSTAVPVYFAPGSGALSGDEFGVITLAGHGAGYTSSDGAAGQISDNGPTAFEDSYNDDLGYDPDVAGDPSTGTTPDLMPLPAADASWSDYVPSVPEPSTLSLLAVGMVAAGLRNRGRRKASATQTA